MAKISVLTISPENEELYFRTLKPADRFTYSRITIKRTLLSRKHLKGLTQKTLLPQITELWNNLNQESKDYWTLAASYSDTNGYRLFVQDTAYRLSHGIDGIATPSNYRQYKAGEILIASPATGIKLIQIHPSNYYIYKKVRGTKSQYEPVLVYEVFGLPFTIGLSYKSDLTAQGAGAYAKLYADVISSYQGIDRHNYANINIPLSSGWATTTGVLNTISGYFISYNLYIELYNVRGMLLFDNIEAYHSLHNFARDPRCNSIDTEFTKAYYQIPKHWAPVSLPTGAEYKSIYPEE